MAQIKIECFLYKSICTTFCYFLFSMCVLFVRKRNPNALAAGVGRIARVFYQYAKQMLLKYQKY